MNTPTAPPPPLDTQPLVEAVAGAWRPRDRSGAIRPHPSWCDLDDAGRREAFEVARESRLVEAALDPARLSTTAKAVLARIGWLMP
jgi:hypothetical protein